MKEKIEELLEKSTKEKIEELLNKRIESILQKEFDSITNEEFVVLENELGKINLRENEEKFQEKNKEMAELMAKVFVK